MNNFAVVLLLLAVAAAGAGGAFYSNYYQPALDDREKLEGEIKGFQAKKNEIQSLHDEIAKIKEEIAKKEADKAKLAMDSNQLSAVVPKLLDSTEAISGKFDVKFQDIRISPLVRAEQWSELPVEMTIGGTYGAIANFLQVVEKRKIINLAAGAINISVSAETDPKTKSPLLTVTLNGKVYIMGG